MANTLSKLTTAGNLYTTGTLDEATFNPTSSYIKNLAAYSQTGSQWRISANSTIISTNELAPDGTYTAVRVRPIGPAYGGVQTPNACWLANIPMVGSAWVRVDTGTRALCFRLNGGGLGTINFTATSTWQRFNTGSVLSTASYNDFLQIADPSGSGFVDYIVWGWQVEKGTTATIYEATGANAIPSSNTLSKLDSDGNYYTLGTIDEVTFNPNQNGYRKNLANYSQDSTTWRLNSAGGGTTITSTSELAPDGTYTAVRVHAIAQFQGIQTPNTCFLAGRTSTISVWLKVDSGTRNITTGTNGGIFGTTWTVTSTWTRFSTTAFNNRTFNDFVAFQDNNSSGFVDFLIWGIQVEIGSAATIYEATGANAIPSSNTLSKLDTTGNHYLLGTYDEVSGILPVTDGLVLYLDASYPESYSGSGTIWNDLSGNGNNGSMINVPVYNYKGYFTFNGSNAAFQVNRPVQDDFTISFWFKTTSSLGSSGNWWSGLGLLDCEVAGNANDFGTSIGAGRVMFGVGNPDTTITSSSLYNNDTWHYVTATRVKSTGAMALYIDTTLVGTATANTNSLTSASNMKIGSLQTNVNYFNGNISVLQVYNRVLSTSEIQQIFQTYKTRHLI